MNPVPQTAITQLRLQKESWNRQQKNNDCLTIVTTGLHNIVLIWRRRPYYFAITLLGSSTTDIIIFILEVLQAKNEERGDTTLWRLLYLERPPSHQTNKHASTIPYHYFYYYFIFLWSLFIEMRDKFVSKFCFVNFMTSRMKYLLNIRAFENHPMFFKPRTSSCASHPTTTERGLLLYLGISMIVLSCWYLFSFEWSVPRGSTHSWYSNCYCLE